MTDEEIEIAIEKILEYHACATGDCPHEEQIDCLKAFIKAGLTYRDNHEHT